MKPGLQALGSAPAASLDGLEWIDSWEDRPDPTGSGARLYVKEWNCSITDLDLGSQGPVWALDQHYRQTDGTPYNAAVAVDGYAGAKLDFYGGMTIPSDWPRDGAVTVTDEYVEVMRYIYAESANTATRQILYVELHEPPPGAPGYNVGVLAGSTVSGTSRLAGVKFEGNTSPAPLAFGRFGVDAGLGGQATWRTGRPVWVLLDYSAADAPCVVADSQSPTAGVFSERASLPVATDWGIEIMAMDSLSNAVGPIRVKRAVLINLT